MRGTNTKGLVLLLVVFWATDAVSAPTLNVPDDLIGTYNSEAHFVENNAQSVNYNVITGPCENLLYAFLGEFNKPSVNYSSASFQSNSIKSLPPTPSAFLLVLVGFLWITAVKDRKLWIAGIAAILCAGQAGFARVPQFAAQLSNSGLGRQCFSNLFCLHKTKNIRWLPDLFCGESRISFERSCLLMFKAGIDRKQNPEYISRCSVSCEQAKNGDAKQNKKIIKKACLQRLYCFDFFNFSFVKVVKQFFFLPLDNVNCRLARGPPG